MRENEIAVLNIFTFDFSLYTDLVFPWFKYIFWQSEIIFDNTNNTRFGIGITTTGENRQLLINSLIQSNSDLVQDVWKFLIWKFQYFQKSSRNYNAAACYGTLQYLTNYDEPTWCSFNQGWKYNVAARYVKRQLIDYKR